MIGEGGGNSILPISLASSPMHFLNLLWVFSILASGSFTLNFLSPLRPIFVLLAFYLASCGAINTTIFADWLATYLTLTEL